MRRIVALVFALSTHVADGATPLAVDFSSGKPADHFTEGTAGRVKVFSAKQVQAMSISDSTARLRDVPVEPATKYTLKLKAAFDGDVESIEENPRFEIFTRLGNYFWAGGDLGARPPPLRDST